MRAELNRAGYEREIDFAPKGDKKIGSVGRSTHRIGEAIVRLDHALSALEDSISSVLDPGVPEIKADPRTPAPGQCQLSAALNDVADRLESLAIFAETTRERVAL